MAKTLLENAVIDFQNQFDALKNITGYNNKQLAKYLDCSERTVSKMRNSPLEVSSKYILKVQALLAAENTRRRIG